VNRVRNRHLDVGEIQRFGKCDRYMENEEIKTYFKALVQQYGMSRKIENLLAK